MTFLAIFLRGLAALPSLIQGIESLFGSKSGSAKKSAALAVVSSAINLTDAVSSKTVANPEGFTAGLGQIIDGVVTCFNASIWSKKSRELVSAATVEQNANPATVAVSMAAAS